MNGKHPHDDPPPAPTKSRISKSRYGVWDFYEEIFQHAQRPGWRASLQHKFREFSDGWPHVRRMITDVANIPGCIRLAIIYAICEIAISVLPAGSIWFEGQLLTIIQTAIDSRTVNAGLLLRISLGRLVCSLLIVLVNRFRKSIEGPLNARIRRWYAAHAFAAAARLDVPTFHSPTARRALNDTDNTSWGKTVVWATLQLVADIAGAGVQLIAHALVLFGVLRQQRDGMLLVMVTLVSQVWTWGSYMSVFSPAKLWLARTVNAAFIKTRGLKRIVQDGNFRKEFVAGNMGEFATSEYTSAAEIVGDQDADWWEWNDQVFDGSRKWIEILEGPFAFIPQLIFVVRAVNYPTELPVSLASLQLVQSATTTFAFTMVQLIARLQSVSTQLANVQKMYNVRDIPNEIVDGTVPFPEDTAQIRYGISLEFRNVSFKYPESENWALRNVSFNILPGQLCVIVGSNGSGKSTILKLVTRLYDPQEGEIFFGGHDIRALKLSDLRDAVSVLFQDYTLFPLSIADNIGLGRPAHAHDASRIADALHLADATALVAKLPKGAQTFLDPPVDDEYSSLLEDTPLPGGPPGVVVDYTALKAAASVEKASEAGLSGGQMQRLAVARTFMRSVVGGDSPVGLMLFDEPSAALDPIAEHNLFDRLRELRGSKTLLFSSHRFGKLTRHADLILYMNESVVVEAGTHTALIAAGGEYARLWQIQVEAFIS
ncbi:HlyB/MsbA family ABC transporter [Epithele typhae]|uniref:HlyB/MsbA family ABC transporter n=1 Tax=Epithele typhae TaxID=378194 RepID=UPI002007F4B0|nr:HlyB/MsbA family ABC transporter [Epithele typhae]KAH9920549.1 HlyB/MsbA family ABC transporter [Epithele typhae]